jgi:multiple sugar transport system permease protein
VSCSSVRWSGAATVMILATLPPLLLGLLIYRQTGKSMTAGVVKG